MHTSYVVQEGVLYFGSHDGHVYAVDVETGEETWQVAAGEAFNSSPAVADGGVYYVDIQGNLIGVDADTGRQKQPISPSP